MNAEIITTTINGSSEIVHNNFGIIVFLFILLVITFLCLMNRIEECRRLKKKIK